jgi:transposase
LKTLGFVFKKTLKASGREREDRVQSRADGEEFQQLTQPKRWVPLDESGVKINMTRLYGRSFQGERRHDAAPNGHWTTVTVLSSIRLDGETERVVFEGAVDGKMFGEYVKGNLAPSLRPGDMVIMDNLSAHKSPNAYAAVREKQAGIMFLPAYSPDLNPIEKMGGKIKQILRGIKARNHEELFAGVGKALSLVSENEAQGWFKSCGYIQF